MLAKTLLDKHYKSLPDLTFAIADALAAQPGLTLFTGGGIVPAPVAKVARTLDKPGMFAALTEQLGDAGISIDKDNSSIDDFGVIRRTFDVNVYGTLNTVEPLLDRMIARRRGLSARSGSASPAASARFSLATKFQTPKQAPACP